VVNSRGQSKENLAIHSINTRQNSNLRLLASNLATHQKGFYYFGIEMFILPSHVKNLSHNTKQFKSALKAFDCVQHNILIDKLQFYRVDGKFNDKIFED
jgi:hypothetical protein